MGLIVCPVCGNSVSDRAASCPRCGEPFASSAEPENDYRYVDIDGGSKNLKRRTADNPEEVERVMRKWNWGAFGLTWVWGVGNGVYWTLLLLIPVFGWVAAIVVAFVLGRRGNRLAWNSHDKSWDSLEDFRRVQRYWAIGAVAVWAIVILLAVILAIVFTYVYNLIPAEGITVDADSALDSFLNS